MAKQQSPATVTGGWIGGATDPYGMLGLDPATVQRVRAARDELEKALAPVMEGLRQSERLTEADLAIRINAVAD